MFEILHEDDDLLVLNKPADLVCHPTKGDVYSSLISRVRLYLAQPSPPSAYVFSERMALPLPVRNERGEGRGEGHPTVDTTPHLQERRPSSPRPSPPSAGGEGEETGPLNTYPSAGGEPPRSQNRALGAMILGGTSSASPMPFCQGLVELDPPNRTVHGKGARPQLVNRLDRETSGVVLVAKTNSAARELRALWERRSVEKEYLAIVHGRVPGPGGEVDAPLGRDERSRVAIKDCVRRDGASAQTRFEVVSRLARGAQEFTVLRVLPLTGRKHQIRIHLAHMGHPIVGDKLYGRDEELYLAFVESRLTSAQREQLLLPNHALHAKAVRFFWRSAQYYYCAEPDGRFRNFLSSNE